MPAGPRLTPWPAEAAPTEPALRTLMQREGLEPYAWSNGPHEVYAAHSHAYNKVIYCVRGSITFGLPGGQGRYLLRPGDRLDLPAGIVHEAVVGDEGVVCLEAHL